ncbi:MAG: LytR C-terminal domain-containing protein [Lachnospiraceae bacterium]|nr:LytR C-terminal domain-containing protein [Lachnospiraceae bacterium]
MGKKVFKIFLTGFLKAILVLLCMILAGTIGFVATRKYYSSKNKKAREAEAQKMISGAKLDTVSRNLIFVHNKNKKSFSSVILEVFDTENDKISYVTIPASMDVTLPSGLYKKLIGVNQDIPQIFKFSKFPKFFKEGDTNVYGYAALVIQYCLDADISYYTVLDNDTFNTVFEGIDSTVNADGTVVGLNSGATALASATDEVTDGTNPFAHDDSYVTTDYGNTDTTEASLSTSSSTSASTVNTKVYRLKDDFMAQFADIKTDEVAFTDYMTSKILDMYMSNLESKDKLSYCKDYMELDESMICYYALPGSYYNKSYMVDMNATASLFASLGIPKVSSTAASEEESDEEPVREVKTVQVLNGSGVQGMAAKWQTKLTNSGFSVPEVGNYESRLNDSLIIVPEEGMGQELKKQFSNATIQIGTVPDGYDAIVVIGLNDATI